MDFILRKKGLPSGIAWITLVKVIMVEVTMINVTMFDVAMVEVIMVVVTKVNVTMTEFTMADVTVLNVTIVEVTMVDVTLVEVNKVDVIMVDTPCGPSSVESHNWLSVVCSIREVGNSKVLCIISRRAKKLAHQLETWSSGGLKILALLYFAWPTFHGIE